MKKHLLFLFAALLPLVASAHDFEVGGIYYNITSETEVEVTFKGEDYWEYKVYSGSITIPTTVPYNGMVYSVTSIGEHAFEQCYSLTSITIPENSRLTSIGNEAFRSCSKLTSITISEGVTSIGKMAFYYCSSLTSITIPENSRLTSIGNEAFAHCSKLTSVTIPEGVTSIGNSTFSSCSSLTSLTIPKSVTSIGDYALLSCKSLISITIPNNVTSIGSYAFYYCSSLTNINFSENSQLTSIGEKVFEGCSSLTSLTIPKSVTSIGECAFYKCSSLTSLTIPKGVTSIGNSAFSGCSSLASIIIPEGVSSIGDYAFSGCSLEYIVLLKNVESIGSLAFANCYELTDVYCYEESVPSTDPNAFNGSYPENATLHVPASAINSYKTTAPWSSFGSIINIEDIEVEFEKCATPTIGYEGGKVVFTCDTEGATIKSNIKENIAGAYNDTAFDLIPTYTITAYATKEKWLDSEATTLTLCWIPCTEEHKSEEDGILTIPAKPVLIQSQGGTISLSGLAGDTKVVVYDLAGRELATAITTDGTATLTTGLEVGSTAVVKIGNNSVKFVIR